MFREIPTPTYDYKIRQLTRAYQQAILRIQHELKTYALTDMQRANAQATLQAIADELSGLSAYSKRWVETNIPEAGKGGVARTLVSLGVVNSLEEALKVAKFNAINREFIAAAVADTQADLLAVTQNIDRKTKVAIRQATAEVMRANVVAGVHGRRTLTREIQTKVNEILSSGTSTGIIDAAGRRWRPEVYVDMLTRTKLSRTYNEATTNEAVARGAFYAVISSHGATDACRFHEGRIMKLTPDAPGNYPTYDELQATGQIFHPNCKHSYSPIRTPDILPQSVRVKAERQAEEGRKAIATGKRNPTSEDVE